MFTMQLSSPVHSEVYFEIENVKNYVRAYKNRRGDWVYRVETDDEVLTDWQSSDLKAIQNELVDAVNHQIYIIDTQKKELEYSGGTLAEEEQLFLENEVANLEKLRDQIHSI